MINNAFPSQALGNAVISQDAKKLPRKHTVSKPVPKGAVRATADVQTKGTVYEPVVKAHITLKKSVSTKPIVVTINKSEEIGTKLSTSPVPAKEINDINVVSEPQQNSSSGKDNSSDSSLYLSTLEDM